MAAEHSRRAAPLGAARPGASSAATTTRWPTASPMPSPSCAAPNTGSIPTPMPRSMRCATPACSLALVTNGAAETQRAKIERFELAHRFHHIQIEGEFGQGKPELAVYRHALERLGCRRRRRLDGRRQLRMGSRGAAAARHVRHLVRPVRRRRARPRHRPADAHHQAARRTGRVEPGKPPPAGFPASPRVTPKRYAFVYFVSGHTCSRADIRSRLSRGSLVVGAGRCLQCCHRQRSAGLRGGRTGELLRPFVVCRAVMAVGARRPPWL